MEIPYAVTVSNDYRQLLISKTVDFLRNCSFLKLIKTPVETFNKIIKIKRSFISNGLIYLNKNQKHHTTNYYSTFYPCLNAKTYIKATYYTIILEIGGLGAKIAFSK